MTISDKILDKLTDYTWLDWNGNLELDNRVVKNGILIIQISLIIISIGWIVMSL